MLSEEEKKAIELLECIKNNSWTTKYIMSSDSKNAVILLNLITNLQKENKEKDKQIDLMAEFIRNHHCFELVVYGLDNECTNKNECKNCIEQYFEKLAKKGE